MSVISKISDINLPPSLINLYATYAFWLFEIKFGNNCLIRFDNTFKIHLLSTLSKDIGQQFFINLLSRSFFSISFIAACFWEVLSSPFRKDILNDRRRGTLTWSQKVFFCEIVISRRVVNSILFNSCFTSSYLAKSTLVVV